MKIKHGLVSCDSHGQLDRNAFVDRMSNARWGDRIPQVVEVEVEGARVHGWSVNGRPPGGRDRFGFGVVNCPAVMHDRRYYPVRWEEVPPKVYDPMERTRALDEDGVDGEVLFPNNPIASFNFAFGDPEYEVACVEAYNAALGAWARASDRYIPIAIIPYLSPIETVVRQVELAVKGGCRGIVMVAEPGLAIKGAHSLNDPYWGPLWETCQALGIPINWHGSGGVVARFSVPDWPGYTRRQAHTVSTGRLAATPTQLIPNLMFSGILDRYPRLKWACAETGAGWLAYVLEACDHEWERHRLWAQGILMRPSDAFRRQVYVDFWFERSGIELRHFLGIDNIMWESDYPHITSTYPRSWDWVRRTVADVPEPERRKLLYQNVLRLYDVEYDEVGAE